MADHERYEDFLESLTPDQLASVLDGKGGVVAREPSRIVELLREIGEYEKAKMGSGEVFFDGVLMEQETQDDAGSMLVSIRTLQGLLVLMESKTQKRLRTLHNEVCEDCRREHDEHKKVRRAFERGIQAAKAAFDEHVAMEQKPWRQSLDDDDEE